jgi:hypothetical protein
MRLVSAGLLLIVIFVLAGCASKSTVVVDNGVQSRVLVPCNDDALCVRSAYDVAIDMWCPQGCKDYPVSYRTKQWEYESSRVEYIYLPRVISVK